MNRLEFCIAAQEVISQKCKNEHRELLKGDYTKPYIK
jgi:hypothetical protein